MVIVVNTFILLLSKCRSSRMVVKPEVTLNNLTLLEVVEINTIRINFGLL